MNITFWNRGGKPQTEASARHIDLGRRGEMLAIEHLEQAGYRIVAANFSLPIGRNLRGVIVNVRHHNQFVGARAFDERVQVSADRRR